MVRRKNRSDTPATGDEILVEMVRISGRFDFCPSVKEVSRGAQNDGFDMNSV